MAILPYLMVEQDVAMQAIIDKNLKEEAEVMQHNENWTVGEAIYSKRWRPPTAGLWSREKHTQKASQFRKNQPFCYRSEILLEERAKERRNE